MNLQDSLLRYGSAVRQKYGFTALVERTSGGYYVRLSEGSEEPHFQEVYETLDVVVGLFAETCSWRPSVDQPCVVIPFPAESSSHGAPYSRIYVERFWSKVDTTGECWVWTGNRNTSSGFGMARTEHGRMLAHRVSWELTHGMQLAADEYILHNSQEDGCGNILCVRPQHLYKTTERRVNRRTA